MEPWLIVVPVAIIVAIVMIAKKVSKSDTNHDAAIGH